MENRNKKSRTSAIFRIVNLWLLVGAVAIACGMFTILFGALLLTRSAESQSAPATAVINVIVASTATMSAQASPTVLPTNTIPAANNPGVISIDSHVQIQGTGGNGLRLRAEPGLDANILVLGSEAEVFRVMDGPIENDGYTWWYLVGPFDDTRLGWAVENYLAIVQNP
jgi:hypothetical protein